MSCDHIYLTFVLVMNKFVDVILAEDKHATQACTPQVHVDLVPLSMF